MADQYRVDIVEIATGKVVGSMSARSESEAERVKRGALINLNHDEYFVTVREPETAP